MPIVTIFWAKSKAGAYVTWLHSKSNYLSTTWESKNYIRHRIRQGNCSLEQQIEVNSMGEGNGDRHLTVFSCQFGDILVLVLGPWDKPFECPLCLSLVFNLICVYMCTWTHVYTKAAVLYKCLVALQLFCQHFQASTIWELGDKPRVQIIFDWLCEKAPLK